MVSGWVDWLRREIIKAVNWLIRHGGPAVALLSASLMGSPASAAAWCQSRITQVLVDASGQLLVLPVFRGDWIALCSVNTTRNGVTSATCSGWVAQATSALLANKEIVLQYGDPISVCSSLPAYYDAPTPTYLSIVG